MPSINLRNVKDDAYQWLDDLARSHGTSVDLEASILLDDAVEERKRREQLFNAAKTNQIRISGPLLSAEEIEEMINWGRA